MKQHALNGGLMLLPLLVSLVLIEIGLRWFLPQDLSGSWRVYSDTGLVMNRSEGTARHSRGATSVLYRFSPPGLRGTAGPAARYRILLLGDSFTFGWLLEDEQTYAHRLQERIDATFGQGTFSIVNAAAGGWGTGSYVAYVEEFGDQVDPDIVLVFISTDDVGRAGASGLYRLRGEEAVRLRAEPPWLKRVVGAIPFWNEMVSSSQVIALLRRGYVAFLSARRHEIRVAGDGPRSTGGANAEASVELTEAVFERLIQWTGERDIELWIATTGWHRPPYTSDEPTERFMAGADAFFAYHDVAFNDPSAAVLERTGSDRSGYIFRDDGHPNARGAKLIAEANWPFLKARLSAFCREEGC